MKTAPDAIRGEIEHPRPGLGLGLDVDDLVARTRPRRSVRRAIMRAARLRGARYGPGPALETARECARRAAGLPEPPPRRRVSAARAGVPVLAAGLLLACVRAVRHRSR
jgi:hypothetical protein